MPAAASAGEPATPATKIPKNARLVSVALKRAGLNKPLSYLLPDELLPESGLSDSAGSQIPIQRGTMVEAPLKNRPEPGWLVDLSPPADQLPSDVQLLDIHRITSLGPSEEILNLADWAAWRWQANPAVFYWLASPPRQVKRLPAAMVAARSQPAASPAISSAPDATGNTSAPEAVAAAFSQPQPTLWQLPPTAQNWSLINEAMSRGNALVLVPQTWRAERLAAHARSQGHNCVLWPQQWELAAAGGCSVVGTRSAVLASMPELSSILMLDEHDASYKETWRRSAWQAREVAAERARRVGIPLVMVSPVPSLEAQQIAPVRELGSGAAAGSGTAASSSPSQPTSSWPKIIIADLRERSHVGLFSHELTDALATASKAVCILNRTGRVRLLACAECASLLVCGHCRGKLEQSQSGAGDPTDPNLLSCSRCGRPAPAQCPQCHSRRVKNLRVGVKQAAADLSRLLREPVGELTAKDQSGLHSRVLLGTTAALHQVSKCDLVAFLEFDQLLLAPNFRAEERALVSLAQAAKLVGSQGSVLLQTRQPDSLVVQAAMQGNPQLFLQADRELREDLQLPPAVAAAMLGGEAAPEYVAALTAVAGDQATPDSSALSPELTPPPQLKVQGPDADGNWLLKAATHEQLLDALTRVPRDELDLQVVIDPPEM